MQLEKSSLLASFEKYMGPFITKVNQLPNLDMEDLDPEKTLVVMIDMINGFCKFGPLSSPFVEAMIPKMASFLDTAIKKEIPVVSYRDAHPESAGEFDYFPPHCLAGSDESKLVDELYRPQLIDVEKNSTNGFLAANPFDLIEDPEKITQIYVIGCVTDICVRDFTTTMNKYLQEINQTSKVWIVENLVDTYAIPDLHDRELEHTLALYAMNQAGIELIRYES